MTSHLATTPPALDVLTVRAPGGPLTVILHPDDATVCAVGYGSAVELGSRLSPDRRERGFATRVGPAVTGAAQTVFDAFGAYFDGEFSALDGLAVDQPGGPFNHAVWAAMRTIPAGQTATYTELAAAAGRPRAVRAAASTCARNLVAVVVPCHRVVRTDGTLGGYRYGLDVKRALLEHEAAK